MPVRLAALIVLLSVAPFNLFAEQQSSTSKALSSKQARALEQATDTPADHLRLANYYQEQVRKLVAKASYHQEMAEMYREHPLPFDGKLAVPMQRHCKEWAARFDKQAERAAVMAALHEYKATGQTADPSTLAHLAHGGLRSTGLNAPNRVPRAGRDQVSLYQALTTASIRFYDQTRVLTYIVDAKGKLPVTIPELLESATAVYEAQDEFLASLSGSQREGMKKHISTVQILRRNVQDELSKLEKQVAEPGNRSQFKTAKKLKQVMERWHNEQEEIGYELDIPIRLSS